MYGKLEEEAFARSVKQNALRAESLPRLIECLVAALGLIALAPIFAACALTIRLSSSGPILFRQKRMGRGGAPFTMFKFRTMYAESPGLLITAGNDSRITPVGRVLRRSKLDELPELFNVLCGEMSFVGPRPEVVELVDLTNPAWARTLGVRPGITDPVTLQFRNEETLLAGVEDKARFYREVVQPYKLEGYLEYIDSRSPAGDVAILLQTIKVIMFPSLAVRLELTPFGPTIQQDGKSEAITETPLSIADVKQANTVDI